MYNVVQVSANYYINRVLPARLIDLLDEICFVL